MGRAATGARPDAYGLHRARLVPRSSRRGVVRSLGQHRAVGLVRWAHRRRLGATKEWRNRLPAARGHRRRRGDSSRQGCAGAWTLARPRPHHTAVSNASRAGTIGLRRLLVLGVLLAALAIWLPFAGVLLIDSQPPVQSDAIVVLAGNAPDRLPWAETLRSQGYADLLIVSNEPVHTHGLETTWLALHRAGVSAPEIPDSSLLVLDDPPPESTIDEARRDADLMVARGLHSALLVTDAFHSRRAELLLNAAFAHK